MSSPCSSRLRDWILSRHRYQEGTAAHQAWISKALHYLVVKRADGDGRRRETVGTWPSRAPGGRKEARAASRPRPSGHNSFRQTVSGSLAMLPDPARCIPDLGGVLDARPMVDLTLVVPDEAEHGHDVAERRRGRGLASQPCPEIAQPAAYLLIAYRVSLTHVCQIGPGEEYDWPRPGFGCCERGDHA